MTFRETPAEAVAAGAPASPYLMRNLRDNDEAIANANTTYGIMLDASVGHVHGTGTRTHAYTFTDRVTIVTGVNDRVPFRFGGGAVAVGNFSSTLTAATYTLTALAAHIQSVMRTSASTTDITVVYDLTEGSATRGLFVFRHTGSSDSPNARILELHFATGTGFATGVGPSIGFARLDKKKSFSYAGDSGFSDGHAQDEFTPGEGGLLSTDAWVAGAFTAAKIASDVISNRCFQSSSVSGSASGDKIANNTITGDKIGDPDSVGTTSIGAGASHTFSITMGSNRSPMAVPYATNTAEPGSLSVTSVTHTSGNDYDVVVKNVSSGSLTVGIVAL